jgi:hypothetical protein
MEFDRPGDKKPEEESQFQKEPEQEIKVDFSAFILSLSSSALVSIGEIPDPITKKPNKNLKFAKQMIDIINILKEKTKGNLTKEEDELIQGLSSELKMKYLQAVNLK